MFILKCNNAGNFDAFHPQYIKNVKVIRNGRLPGGIFELTVKEYLFCNLKALNMIYK